MALCLVHLRPITGLLGDFNGKPCCTVLLLPERLFPLQRTLASDGPWSSGILLALGWSTQVEHSWCMQTLPR